MRIIGASNLPTPYKIKTPRQQYVRCGADVLLNGAVHDLDGESRCIVCERSTQIRILRGKVAHVEPPNAVLHVVEIPTERGTMVVCEASLIFDRDPCLQTWLKSYKGLPGQVFKLQEYMPRASRLVADRKRLADLERSDALVVQNERTIRCADCECSPIECRESKSALECPRCRLEYCCCWTPTGIA